MRPEGKVVKLPKSAVTAENGCSLVTGENAEIQTVVKSVGN
jgi:hypothetical protein